MSTTQFAPQLRPLSVGEVLDASFKVVRQNFGTLALCVLVVALPLSILDTLIAASTMDNAFNLDTGATNDVSSGTAAAGGLIRRILDLVLSTLASAACFRAVSGAYLGQSPTWQESLSFAATRLGPLIWLSILYGFGLIIPFLLLIIPGIWLAVAWSVSYPALLSEDVRGIKALGRSFNLVRGRWWATFAAIFVMFLIVVVISLIVGALFAALLITSLDSEVLAAILTTIANVLSSLITLPLFAALLTIIYYDLRVRKEGFDLSLLARGVGEPTDAANVASSSGLGGYEPPGGGFAPPQDEPAGGGFAPPQAPGSAPDSQPPPSQPPPSGPAPGGGLQSGDPLAPPPERREGDGGTSS
jgi:hypothetical protein